MNKYVITGLCSACAVHLSAIAGPISPANEAPASGWSSGFGFDAPSLTLFPEGIAWDSGAGIELAQGASASDANAPAGFVIGSSAGGLGFENISFTGGADLTTTRVAGTSGIGGMAAALGGDSDDIPTNPSQNMPPQIGETSSFPSVPLPAPLMLAAAGLLAVFAGRKFVFAK